MKTFLGDYKNFLLSMPDKSVDVILTDPPYKEKDIVNMPELRRVCRGHIIMFCDPRFRFFVPDEVALWMKPPSSKNTTKHLAHPWEEILIERHGDVYNAGFASENYGGIYYDFLLEKRVHPNQKPATLLERLIAIYGNPGDIVFDPFAGSGATLRAAERLGRSAIGCEKEKKYYDLFAEGE